ncbi:MULTISPECIES: phosphorothioated DNA-binding restriction endonuclease [unclassified Paenibacillus]|uniref:phosphorothioated DNA-binding restriction endonuclease n=1 Tax=unclassified Paenibacillus TaxID=185978 RepID=UPI00020D783F|nr:MULTISPECIES: HNH endonuclease [unclassified Paenibacillus]EGL19840.1 hypothetical protein HMPREF9413_4802 [Paenibacillus sp. HGF7]EPD81346.1 hypothetical protein HMPREF1207_05104 [Paenibacillus sp. HGH0039]
MNFEELKHAMTHLGTWKRDGKRAPHKSLLTLYALSELYNNRTKLISYNSIRSEFKKLLFKYGNSTHPEYPYVYLMNDGYWRLDREINKKFTLRELSDTMGGFTEEVYSLLLNNKDYIITLIKILLDSQFPETQHEDILSDLSIEDIIVSTRKNRSGLFRKNILIAYEFRCAVCGFNIQIDHFHVGVEAAHIKWHKFGGPDVEENGLALCALHHKLFDYGVFTLSKNNIILVSAIALGHGESTKMLLDYHGREIHKVNNPKHRPNKLFVEWHNDEVFKRPERFLEIK